MNSRLLLIYFNSIPLHELYTNSPLLLVYFNLILPYKSPSTSHFVSLLSWGWLLQTSASHTEWLKLSTKNLRCSQYSYCNWEQCHVTLHIIILDHLTQIHLSSSLLKLNAYIQSLYMNSPPLPVYLNSIQNLTALREFPSGTHLLLLHEFKHSTWTSQLPTLNLFIRQKFNSTTGLFKCIPFTRTQTLYTNSVIFSLYKNSTTLNKFNCSLSCNLPT